MTTESNDPDILMVKAKELIHANQHDGMLSLECYFSKKVPVDNQVHWVEDCIFVCSTVDNTPDYESSVKEAERIFQKICPESLFYPEVVQPEAEAE